MYFLNGLWSGISHVIPYGYDHILFIISILIGLNTFRKCVIVSLVFTVAHSVSLFLSVFNLFEIAAEIIEPIIAASILFSSISNIYLKGSFDFRIKTGVIFLFGLIHGLGFASVFKENYSNSNEIIITLLGFNLGVEMAQLLFVSLVFLLFINQKKFKEESKNNIMYLISMGIGIIAMFILISRLLN